MMSQICTFIIALATVFNIGQVKAAADSAYSIDSVINIGETCNHEINVKGPGIEDKFQKDCSTVGISGYFTDKVLIFGNPKDSKFVLYSDEPSTLYVITDNSCEKRSYKTVADKTEISKTEVLIANDCKKLKEKVVKKIKVEKKLIPVNLDFSSVLNTFASYQESVLNKVRQLLQTIMKNIRKQIKD